MNAAPTNRAAVVITLSFARSSVAPTHDRDANGTAMPKTGTTTTSTRHTTGASSNHWYTRGTPTATVNRPETSPRRHAILTFAVDWSYGTPVRQRSS